MFAIKDVKIIDVTERLTENSYTILIDHGCFIQIDHDLPIPEEASVIEAGGLYAIPGMIDMHSHIGGSAIPGYPGSGSRHETYDYVMAREGFLHWGVTTVRSCGDQTEDILSFREDEKNGKILAPRVVCCGPYVQNPDGHPWGTVFFRDEEIKEKAFVFVDTDAPIEDQIERIAERGVDFIKVFYAHLDLIKNTEDAPRMTEVQLKRVIDSAHRNGLKCACHVDGPLEMLAAARAGADTIEHMINVGNTEKMAYTDGMIEIIKENGTVIDPTLIATLRALRSDAPDVYEPALQGVFKLYQAGVPIAVGCDSGIPNVPFGESLHDEMICLNEAGIPTKEVIRMATIGNARILGMEDRIGSIEEGKEADLVLLKENPLEDLRETRNIALVMKKGRIVRENLQ